MNPRNTVPMWRVAVFVAAVAIGYLIAIGLTS